MNKLLSATAGVIMTAMLATPVLANNFNASGSASVRGSASLSATQLSCIAPAVDARESAVINAQTTYNTAILNALTARRTSLAAAFKISNNQERQLAIVASWKVYTTAVQKARMQLKTDTNAAWKTFTAASVQCKISLNGSGSSVLKTDIKKNDKRRGHGVNVESNVEVNSGLHLGDFKKMWNHDLQSDVKANGHVKLDLSL